MDVQTGGRDSGVEASKRVKRVQSRLGKQSKVGVDLESKKLNLKKIYVSTNRKNRCGAASSCSSGSPGVQGQSLRKDFEKKSRE